MTTLTLLQKASPKRKFFANAVLAFSLLSLLPTMGISQEQMDRQEVQDCTSPMILSVTTTGESACGAGDGSITISIQDRLQGAHTYSVLLEEEKGTSVFEGITGNGVLTLEGIKASGFNAVKVVRENDNCESESYEDHFIVRHGCDDSIIRNSGCGSGTVSYTNCDNELIYVNLANISPNTYIYLDNDYIGCIGYVNSSCQIEPSQDVYCGNYTLTAPTPGNGYQYGNAVFTKHYGLTSYFGISELAAERINWIMCNGPSLGYSPSQINQAIWYYTNTYSSCNSLCAQASSAVTSVQGGIDEQMLVYVPTSSGVQPFIENKCYCSLDVTCEYYTGGSWYTSGDCSVSVCEGEVLYLSVNPNGATYEWEGPNGFSGNGNNGGDILVSNSITTADAGTYSVTVTDANGCMGTADITVTVNTAPSFQCEYNIDNSGWVAGDCTIELCEGQSLDYSYPGCNSNWQLTLTGPNGFNATGSADCGHIDVTDAATTDLSGTYTATVTNLTTGCSSSKSVEITVNENPTLVCEARVSGTWMNISSCEVTVCEGTDLALSFKPDGVGGNWTGPNGFSATGVNDIFLGSAEMNEAGVYTVTYTDGNGCSSSTSITVTVDDLPDVTVTSKDATCGNNNGEIIFTFPNHPTRTHLEFSFDGGASYQPQVPDNSGTKTYDGFAPGTYNVYVRWGDDDCPTSLGNVYIKDLPGPSVNAGNDDEICIGESTTLSATATGGSDPVTLTWEPGGLTGTSITVNPTTTTTYTVTATDVNGCTDTDQVTVTVNPLPTYSINNIFCSGFFFIYNIELTTDADQVTASAGTVADNGGGSFTITGIPNNTDVDLTFTNTTTGCVLNATVTDPNCLCPNVLAPVSGGDQEICQSEAIPTLSVTLTEAQTTVDWYDAPSGGNLLLANSLTYTPTAAGTYYAEARRTNFGSCVSDSRTPVTLTINPLPNADAGNDKTICEGESTTLTATGGTSYEWNTGGLSAAITVSPAVTTSYSVTVTDANGCENTDQVTVNVNTLPQASVSSTVDPSCGDSNGEIIFTFSDDPNRTSIEFSLDGGATYPLNVPDDSGTASFTGLTPGTYDLWVRWGNNDCPVDLGQMTLTDQEGPDITAGNDLTICVGETATLSASTTSGTSPVNIVWQPGNLSGASVDVTPAATTTYTATATDANGCTDSDQLIVEVDNTFINPDGPGVVDICEGATATFPILTNAQKPPYNYIEYIRFDNQQSNPYTATDSYTYLDEFALPAMAGSITSSNFPLVGNSSTTYYVYACVKPDPAAGYCQPFAEFVVTVHPELTVVASDDQTICEGGSVTLTANINGGIAPYTIVWTDGGTQVGTGEMITVSPTTTTTYTVSVIDDNGACDATDQVIVTVEDDPSITIFSNEPNICVGGSVQLTAMKSGGLDCDDVQWKFRPGTTGAWTNVGTGDVYFTETTLAVGTYQYQAEYICNGEGCDNTESNTIIITVVPDPEISVSINTNNVCEGETATLVATTNDGIECQDVQWQYRQGISGTWNDLTTGNSLVTDAGLQAGTYQYRAVYTCDGNGCDDVNSDPTTFTITPYPVISVDNATLCSGNTMTFTAPSNPAGTNYNWNFGSYATPATATGAGPHVVTYSLPEVQLGNATATVSVTANLNACETTDNAIITIIDTPDGTLSSTDATCGDDNGTITITYSDNPDQTSVEFSINGTDFINSPDNAGSYTFSDLTAGTYQVSARWGDDTCPVILGTINIEQQNSPTIDAGDDVTICEGEPVTLTATADGGTGQLTITWEPGGQTGASIVVSPVTTQTYTATVVDENGCSVQDIVTVNVDPAFTSGINAPTTRCAGEGILFAADPPVAGATYDWSFTGPATPTSAATESTIVTWDNVPGIYTATLTITKGECTETYTHDINITQEVFAAAGDDVSICQGGSTQIGGDPTGPAGSNYEWSPNFFMDNNTAANPTVNPPITTTYSVTVTQNGCVRVASVTVTVDVDLNPSPEAGADQTICDGETATIGGTVDATADYYEWRTNYDVNDGPVAGNGQIIEQGTPGTTTTIDVSPTSTTKYYVLAYNIDEPQELQCVGVDSVVITVNPTPVAEAGPNQTICAGQETTLTASGSGGTPGYTYEWNTGATTASITVSPIINTTYTVTVTDTNGCEDTDQVEVTVNQDLCTSLGDFVWNDLDADGIQDGGEPGVEGVTVNLKDDNGNVIETTTTDNTGFYEFTDLVPGTYSVQFVLPGGYQFSPLDAGGDDALDSDADPNMSGMTATTTLAAGDNDPTLDAGIYEYASLGNFVWEDIDGDGVQDGGEPGISGVTVTLQDDMGNTLETTTTDGSGF
ncbi:MAG: carboxypeptidase regulatory-like domain-containing protein, partial [Chitinophagales bacterium]|nr:carboxypeptidase regulatory-like domain-containing protein [Chitinophagales bacterium]